MYGDTPHIYIGSLPIFAKSSYIWGDPYLWGDPDTWGDPDLLGDPDLRGDPELWGVSPYVGSVEIQIYMFMQLARLDKFAHIHACLS